MCVGGLHESCEGTILGGNSIVYVTVSLLVEQGNIIAAELLYKRSLDIQERALGPDHPAVTTTLTNFAQLLVQQVSERLRCESSVEVVVHDVHLLLYNRACT